MPLLVGNDHMLMNFGDIDALTWFFSTALEKQRPIGI